MDRKDCPSGVTHWRRLRLWQNMKGFEDLWKYILELLFRKGKLILKTASIDGTFIPSFSFQDTTSYSGKYHKTGTKVSLTVEEQGIPLSGLQTQGSSHDAPLAIPTIKKIPTSILSAIERMLGDKGYDDTKIRIFLHEKGISSGIPQRELPMSWQEKILRQKEIKKRNQKTNAKRFVIERTNAWTKSFRRLRFRFDYSMLSFTAFLNLAFVVICIRKLLP